MTAPGRGAGARFIAGAAEPAHFPALPYPEIAFAGRSNVGKSSLLNRFVGQRGLARVSKTPGRTQQINFFALGDRLTVVDLPGYGFARVPAAVQTQWRVLVEAYLSGRPNLCGVVVLIDLRRGIEDDDWLLIDYLGRHHIPAILAATKADKLSYGERQRRGAALSAAGRGQLQAVVLTSAHSGEGVQRLRHEVDAALQHREARG